MGEKKNSKVIFLVILLLLAIIAIVVMGMYIYKINNEKEIEIQKSTALQVQVDDLNKNVNELQEKIGSISNTINGNSSSSKSSFKKGTYAHSNQTIKFDETSFTLALDDNTAVYGSYEVKDNNTLVCKILSHEIDKGTEHATLIDVDKNESWSITFSIKDEKTLEVTKIDIPNREVEIIIGIYNVIVEGFDFILV